MSQTNSWVMGSTKVFLPSRHPRQFLGPSQKVARPLHPWGSSFGEGILSLSNHREGSNIVLDWPQAFGFVFIGVKGIIKICIRSEFWVTGESTTCTCPLLTVTVFIPLTVRERGIMSSCNTTRCVWGDAGWSLSLQSIHKYHSPRMRHETNPSLTTASRNSQRWRSSYERLGPFEMISALNFVCVFGRLRRSSNSKWQ